MGMMIIYIDGVYDWMYIKLVRIVGDMHKEDSRGWRENIQKQMVKLWYRGSDSLEEVPEDIQCTEHCKHSIHSELLLQGEKPFETTKNVT